VPFIIQSKQDINAQGLQVSKFSSKYSKLIFWGCSAELFSLLPIMNLQEFTLCDSSQVKQKSYYKGIPISNPSAIQKNGVLIIAPYLYGNEIEKSALEMGWSKEAIYRLR